MILYGTSEDQSRLKSYPAELCGIWFQMSRKHVIGKLPDFSQNNKSSILFDIYSSF